MKRLFPILILLIFCYSTNGQINQFEVKESGIVIPRVDKNSISAPESGQVIYDITSSSFWFYDNQKWLELKEDNDQDESNELQNMIVSLFGDTLYLEGGNHIIVPGISDANYIKDGNGNVYTEVEILGQVWLKPNLSATRYNDGSPIEKSETYAEWGTLSTNNTPTYGWYNLDSITNAPRYGALYNWFVVDTLANGGKNVCPIGYKVPDVYDLYQLRDTLEPTNTSIVGQHLKAVGTEFWIAPNAGVLDTYGFNFRGGGQIRATGSQWEKEVGMFLTTSDYVVSTSSYVGYLYPQGNVFSPTGYPKAYGYSIRCLKE
ncbi:fibrobacter succinogenes major paralogous domain-containing protein [Portibacter lacus]|uniref:Fibrobacter succinogenes major paralogous domain-containing protein n=1 Tax=Portibacter lacus TaxID=1099794 RepID=A0AA37WCK6_9BACT|nr:fibrobacter succinogenes major paralogous domain-containing protein [Portibacter lacus]GLR16586.1 hypothetical protein GCM10007940_12010 [Portibacter lacus]